MSANWTIAGSSEGTMCSCGGWAEKVVWESVHSMGTRFRLLLPPLPALPADWVSSTGLFKRCQPNTHALYYYCLLILTVANLGLSYRKCDQIRDT